MGRVSTVWPTGAPNRRCVALGSETSSSAFPSGLVPCILVRDVETTETNCTDRPRWLGLPRSNQGQRDRPGAETELRPPAQGFPEHADPHIRPLCGAACRTDGQQRSGPYEYGRGPHHSHGYHAHRPDDREWRIFQTAAAT